MRNLYNAPRAAEMGPRRRSDLMEERRQEQLEAMRLKYQKGAAAEAGQEDEDAVEEDEGSESSSSEEVEALDEDESAKQLLSRVSFGSLAKAQNALDKGKKRKHESDEAPRSAEQEASLQAMRERLRELREKKDKRDEDAQSGGRLFKNSSQATARKDMKDAVKSKDAAKSGNKKGFFDDDGGESSGSDSDSDSDSEEDNDPRRKLKRSSKHAPMAMPANRAVTRHREVVAVPQIKSRDPRFDVTSGHLDRHVINQRYAFLQSYEADEITQLKKALKDPKAKLSAEEREKLKRKVVSLESKLAAAKSREREEKVRRQHKQAEREAVKQGKKPFYLKKSEVREQALKDRFGEMKGKQRDKVIQRRRKKLATRERRDMPAARRG